MDKSLIFTLVSIMVAGILLAIAMEYGEGIGIVCTSTIIVGYIVHRTKLPETRSKK